MKKLNLDILINASPEKVWDCIIDPVKYRKWASAFMEGCYFEGGWNKGDSIQFLAVNEAGAIEGMVSEIAESTFPEYISIRHIGMVSNGVIDMTSDMVKAWTPSYENYTLEKLGDHQTRFVLDMDANEEYYDMFLDMWPRALGLVKEIAEA